MPAETHPIDARPSLSLIAASILIVSLGVLALTAHLHPRSGLAEAEAVAEFGD